MKKSPSKLSLSRETLRTLEDLSPFVGARPFSGTGRSCPEVCGPVVELADLR